MLQVGTTNTVTECAMEQPYLIDGTQQLYMYIGAFISLWKFALS